MQFDSFSFVIFLTLTLVCFQVMPNWKSQKGLLLIASYIFYGAWAPALVVLLFASTLVDYVIAQKIERSSSAIQRKIWLWLSISSNLGVLAYFKYAQFLMDTIEESLGVIGIQYHAPELNIILPIGISFYIFQTLSYTIDVYRRKLASSKSFLDFAFFVSFFPQLVAGPIVRAVDFLPQCIDRKKIEPHALIVGMSFLAWGVFQKVVLADGIFAPVADAFYAGQIEPSLFKNILSVFAFSGQIYCDFAGYSLCAVGIAMMFGFSLPDNFNAPYAARGFSEFWQRWHISLSQWLRDYVYISFGGNRSGQWITFRNLVITMFLGGLWHGASWNFVIWGLLHGVLLVLEHAYRHYIGRSIGFLAIPGTFIITTLLWIPFRSGDLQTSLNVMHSIVDASIPLLGAVSEDQYLALISLLGLFFYQVLRRNYTLQQTMIAVPASIQTLTLAMIIFLIAIFSTGDSHAFIYFQF